MGCLLPQVERLSHEMFQVRRESGRSDWLQSAHVPARARDARGTSPTTSPAWPSATRWSSTPSISRRCRSYGSRRSRGTQPAKLLFHDVLRVGGIPW